MAPADGRRATAGQGRRPGLVPCRPARPCDRRKPHRPGAGEGWEPAGNAAATVTRSLGSADLKGHDRLGGSWEEKLLEKKQCASVLGVPGSQERDEATAG